MDYDLVIAGLLFEWPARGGGNVHTLELAARLTR